jgi:hypothetical protein
MGDEILTKTLRDIHKVGNSERRLLTNLKGLLHKILRVLFALLNRSKPR